MRNYRGVSHFKDDVVPGSFIHLASVELLKLLSPGFLLSEKSFIVNLKMSDDSDPQPEEVLRS